MSRLNSLTMAEAGGAVLTRTRVEKELVEILQTESRTSRPDYVRPVRPWKPHPTIAPLDPNEKALYQLARRRNSGSHQRRYVAMDLLPRTMKIVQDHGMYDWFNRSSK